jgi:hypothetical protein
MGDGSLARSVCSVASNPVGDVVHAGFELPSPITSNDVLAIPNSLGGVRSVDGCLNAVEDDNRTDRDDGRRNASGDEDTHGVLGLGT